MLVALLAAAVALCFLLVAIVAWRERSHGLELVRQSERLTRQREQQVADVTDRLMHAFGKTWTAPPAVLAEAAAIQAAVEPDEDDRPAPPELTWEEPSDEYEDFIAADQAVGAAL